MKLSFQNVATQALAAAHDAHAIAGELMVEKLDAEELQDAALQLERTARLFRKLAGLKGDKKQ